MAETYVFDFDRTLQPGESCLSLIERALTGDPNAADTMSLLAAIGTRFIEGRADIGERALVADVLSRLSPGIIADYVAERPAFDPSLAAEIRRLQADGHLIMVISNAFAEWVVPLAARLGVDESCVAANRFAWEKGRIIGVVPAPLMSPFGKHEILSAWRRAGLTRGAVTMIGDSGLDFATFELGSADAFIAAEYFGGGEWAWPTSVRRARSIDELITHLREPVVRARPVAQAASRE
ncbi:MAG: HAD-IB family phosphatase [Bosea sp.]|uniref:HAD family hydrolase n=1 Tax=Bosea sp. (in: a-proteobacteria) TaxID=1871050 RepID=UPI0023947F8D|nr:HAD-IB family phosphatase [Bosea sp. (in: a-proteobacteria)]MCP4739769.1 HAD-IB family phosphatase [Bosea sp. (in: a-proteobacteria)]